MFDELGERIVLTFVGASMLYALLLSAMDFIRSYRVRFRFSSEAVNPPSLLSKAPPGNVGSEAPAYPEALKTVALIPLPPEKPTEKRRLKLD